MGTNKFLLLIGFLLAGCGKADTVVAGAIRMAYPGEDWKVIEDAGHMPLNVLQVNTFTWNVHVCYPKAAKVISFTVTADESYAAKGIFFGASVGAECAAIYHYRIKPEGGVEPISAVEMPLDSGNVWFYGIFR